MGMKLDPDQLRRIASLLETIDNIGVPVKEIEAEGHILHLHRNVEGNHHLRGAALIRTPDETTTNRR